MELRLSQVDTVTVVDLGERVDGQTVPALQAQLMPLAEPGCRILLDMSGVTFLSSAGLRLLLLLYRHIDGNDGRIALSGLSEVIRDTMAVTGFLQFFTAYDTLEEGVAALQQP